MKTVIPALLVAAGAVAWVAQDASAVVITEILYNPASDEFKPDIDEPSTKTQFIELFNTSGSPVSLAGWTLDDEDADGPNTLPAVILPGRSFAIVAGSSAADFLGAFGPLPAGTILISLDDLGQEMIHFSNNPFPGSEVLRLADAGGNLIDEVAYDDYDDWPTNLDGYSIGLLPTAFDAAMNDIGANWVSASNTSLSGSYASTPFGVFNRVEFASPGISPVPEPSGAAIMLLASLAAAARRTRKLDRLVTWRAS